MPFVLLLPAYSSCIFLLFQTYYHCLLLVIQSSFHYWIMILYWIIVIGFVGGEIGIQKRRTVLLPLFWG